MNDEKRWETRLWQPLWEGTDEERSEKSIYGATLSPDRGTFIEETYMTKNKKSLTTAIWAVRDVSHEARTAAKLCAKKDRTPLGEWVSNAILQNAKKSRESKKEIARPEDVMDHLKTMFDKIEKLSNRMEKPWWEKILGK